MAPLQEGQGHAGTSRGLDTRFLESALGFRSNRIAPAITGRGVSPNIGHAHLPLFFMQGNGSGGQSFPIYLLHVPERPDDAKEHAGAGEAQMRGEARERISPPSHLFASLRPGRH